MRYSFLLLICFFLSLHCCCLGQVADLFSDKLKTGAVLSLKKPLVVKPNQYEASIVKVHSTTPPYFMGTVTFMCRSDQKTQIFPEGSDFEILEVEEKVNESRVLNKQELAVSLSGSKQERINFSILVNQRFDEFLKTEDIRMENLKTAFFQYFELKESSGMTKTETADP